MESKLRFKMYKDGKKWVITGVLTAAIGVGMTNFVEENVHADTTDIVVSSSPTGAASNTTSSSANTSSSVSSNSQSSTSSASSSVVNSAEPVTKQTSAQSAESSTTSLTATPSSVVQTKVASSADAQSSVASVASVASSAVKSQSPQIVQRQVKMLVAVATTPQTVVDTTPATSVTWSNTSVGGNDFYIPTSASGSFVVPTNMAVGDRIDLGILTVTGKVEGTLTPHVTSPVVIPGVGTFDGRYITLTNSFNDGQTLNYTLNPIVFGNTAHTYTTSPDMTTTATYLGVSKQGTVTALTPIAATKYTNDQVYNNFSVVMTDGSFVSERAFIASQSYYQSALNGSRDTSLLVQPSGNYVLVQQISAADAAKITSVKLDIAAVYSTAISPDGTQIVSDNNGDGYADKSYVEPGLGLAETEVNPTKDESASDLINNSVANTWGYVINSDGSMTAYLNVGPLADLSVSPAQVSNAILNQQWAGTQAGVTAAQTAIAANPAFSNLIMGIAYYSTPGEDITINSTTSSNDSWSTSSILVPSGSGGVVSPVPQVVGVQYVDDDNSGAVIGSGTTNSTGLAGDNFSYTAPTNSDGTLADPEGWVPTAGLSTAAVNLANYTLDPSYSGTVNGVYDSISDTNGPSQFVVIHLKHAINSVQQNVTDTVHYVGAGVVTPADNIQTINYNQNTDQVTKDVTYVPVNQAMIVLTPDLTEQGYTPSSVNPSGYNDETVNFGTALTSSAKPVNNLVTVTYVPIDYTLTSNYVDSQGNVLAPAVSQTNENIGDSYTTSAKVINGYYLTTVPSNAAGKFGAGNVTVNYVYEKLGNLVPTPSNPNDPNWPNTPSTQYPNNPSNPGQPGTVTIPTVPGYTPTDSNGNPLTPGTSIMPGNPGTDTNIMYVPIDYTLTANYVDGQGNVLAPAVSQLNENIGDSYTTSAKVINGYYLTTIPSNVAGKFGAGNVTVNYVYGKLGNLVPTPSNPNDPNWPNTPSTQYPNNPSNPGQPGTVTIPTVPGYTPTDSNGNPLTPGTSIMPGNPGTDTNITYVPIDYTLTTNYVDGQGNVLAPAVSQLNENIGDSYTTSAKVINGYYLTAVPSNAAGRFEVGNVTVSYVYAKLGHLVPNIPGVSSVVYPNDPNNPSGAGDPLIPNIPGYTPFDGNGQPLRPGTPYPINPNEPGADITIYYVKDKVPTTPNQNNHSNKPKDDVVPVQPKKTISTDNDKTKQIPMSRVAMHKRPVMLTETNKRTATQSSHISNRLPQTGENGGNQGQIMGLSLLSLIGVGMSLLGIKRKKH